MQWVAVSPHNRKILGLNLGLGAFLCGIFIFSPCVHGFPPGTLFSSYSPRHECRLIGDYKLPLVVIL